jgi:hypothetical protein
MSKQVFYHEPGELGHSVDQAWLKANAPPGSKFFRNGTCEIPVNPLDGYGRWQLYLRTLRRHVRDVFLTCCDDSVGIHGTINVARIYERAELVNLFNRISQDEWIPFESAPSAPTRKDGE